MPINSQLFHQTICGKSFELKNLEITFETKLFSSPPNWGKFECNLHKYVKSNSSAISVLHFFKCVPTVFPHPTFLTHKKLLEIIQASMAYFSHFVKDSLPSQSVSHINKFFSFEEEILLKWWQLMEINLNLWLWFNSKESVSSDWISEIKFYKKGFFHQKTEKFTTQVEGIFWWGYLIWGQF